MLVAEEEQDRTGGIKDEESHSVGSKTPEPGPDTPEEEETDEGQQRRKCQSRVGRGIII